MTRQKDPILRAAWALLAWRETVDEIKTLSKGMKPLRCERVGKYQSRTGHPPALPTDFEGQVKSMRFFARMRTMLGSRVWDDCRLDEAWRGEDAIPGAYCPSCRLWTEYARRRFRLRKELRSLEAALLTAARVLRGTTYGAIWKQEQLEEAERAERERAAQELEEVAPPEVSRELTVPTGFPASLDNAPMPTFIGFEAGAGFLLPPEARDVVEEIETVGRMFKKDVE